MSAYSVPDRGSPVNVPLSERPIRPAGIGPRPVAGRFLIADYNQEWRHRSAGELLRAAESFWRLPQPLQAGNYYRLATLACEAADRLLVLSIVDAGDAESEVVA